MVAMQNLSLREEWGRYWKLVLACSIGFSYGAVATYATGLFIEPLSDEFGWSRAEIAGGMSLAALLSIPLAPVLGFLIDRFGTRRLAFSGIIGTALCFSLFSMMNGSLSVWLSLWALYAILSVGINSTVWAAAVSGVFSSGRGLALGVTLSGAALAQVIAPPLTQWLIEAFGWRSAFVLLGVGWGGPGLILCLMYLFDVHDQRKRETRAIQPADLPGLSVAQAVRTLALYRIGASTLIMMILTIGMIVHQVPLLTEIGISRQTAAFLASLTGVAGIFGKLVSGYLMDRMDAGLISCLTIGIASLAFVLLLLPSQSLPLMVIAMIVLGYTNGCKFQVCAYLTSRYVGMRNFGKVFGVMSCLVALGAGLGPFLAGLIHDLFGSYRPLVMIGIPASLLSGLLLFRLGPYPIWKTEAEVVLVGAAPA